MPNNFENNHNTFAYRSLEDLRNRMLDLTLRNVLLNYKHPVKSLQIVNSNLDVIATSLLNQKKLEITPVPQPSDKELETIEEFTKIDDKTNDKIVQKPSAKQWAEYLDINTEYDLESCTNINDTQCLQTLLYNDKLESKIRVIRSDANSSIEEMGTNTLFITLGFLEWYESENSNAKNLSPLFNIPINIERDTSRKGLGVASYTIASNDDEIQTNLTLSEKLLNDFGISLPNIEEDVLPKEYLKLVQEAISLAKPRWKVKYYASIVLLNFSKQAMYRDLDPKNWHKNKIENHTILSQLFGSKNSNESSSIKHYEEYSIDNIEDIHYNFPLVYDADSSQHSALIDAIDGKNLVIEGPPGSGKSQTITNLIASALNSNKSVLFVAEKMAALNVVKSKLDNVGLGGFCLELHSHKTNKLRILQDLKDQLESFESYKSSKDFEVTVQRYEGYKTQLNDYANLINKPLRDTGYSIYDILNKATKLRLELDINIDDIEYKKNDHILISESVIYEALQNATIFQKEYAKIASQSLKGTPETHYWYGTQKNDYMDYEVKKLLVVLEQWNNQLTTLYDSWQPLSQKLKLEKDNIKSISETLDYISKLPDITDDIKINQLPSIASNIKEIESFLSRYSLLKAAQNKLLLILSSKVVHGSNNLNQLDKNLNNIRELTSDSLLTVDDLWSESKLAHTLLTSIERISGILNEIRHRVPSSIQPLVNVSREGFRELQIFVRLVESLPGELWQYRDDVYDSSALDVVLPQLTQIFVEIDPLHNSLSEIFDLTKLPDLAHLKQHKNNLNNDSAFKWFSSTWRESKQVILSLSTLPGVKLLQLEPKLNELITYVELLNRAKSISDNDPTMQQQFIGADTPIHRAVVLRQWYKSIRQEYGTSFGERVDIGNTLINIEQNLAFAIKESYNNTLANLIVIIEQDLQHLIKVFAKFFDTQASNQSLSNMKLDDKESPIHQLVQKLDIALESLQKQVQHTKITLTDLVVSSQNTHNFMQDKQLISNILEKNKFLKQDFSVDDQMLNTSEVVLKSYAQTISLSKILAENPVIFQYINSNPTFVSYRFLQDMGKAASDSYYAAQQLERQFYEEAQVDNIKWLESNVNSLLRLIERNDQALNHKNTLEDWQIYLRAKQDLLENGFKKIIISLESNNLEVAQIAKVVELSLFQELSKEIFATHDVIKKFSSSRHLDISEKFRSYDKRLLELQREQIAYNASQVKVPVGNNSGLVKTLTEASLIKREAAKKTRHISIRELLDRSANAVQALKPCFMMSPMSVAQYLKPDNFEFDLVVMDEASQIFPEDAIGAIARGKSIVIVGDPKQLPPSNFFKSISNIQDGNQNTTALEESESILDAVSPIFSTRKLKWHYRSRHESLIAFSNVHFYDSSLILFPSPINTSDELGIRYKHIDAKFNDGVNSIEALKVVELLSRLLIDSPGESIGIVAMNSRQREEIEHLLEIKLKEDPHFNNAYDNYKNPLEPIFIKNLENVQGDERDVIIISMTYGPNEIRGKVAQRFGPINQEGGWRRLNVLLTRSKKRMHIISSMHSGDILVNSDSKDGVKALRAFLEYCEKGHLHETQITGKQPDSDFEISVMNRLKERGYECMPQVGVAGFFIDLAVRNPNRPEEFIMGIECDGATYHSGKSARDRDRLRQEILEGLGWNIQRIWSTDWFRNPNNDIQRIVRLLDEIVAKGSTIKSTQKPVHIQVNEELSENEFTVTNSKQTKEKIEEVTTEKPEDLTRLQAKIFSSTEDRIDTSDFSRHGLLQQTSSSTEEAFVTCFPYTELRNSESEQTNIKREEITPEKTSLS